MPKVSPVEVHQIEGVEDDGVGPPPHGKCECPKIGNTVSTLNNGLTVKNCRFARKVACGKDDRGIAVGPIVPVAG